MNELEKTLQYAPHSSWTQIEQLREFVEQFMAEYSPKCLNSARDILESNYYEVYQNLSSNYRQLLTSLILLKIYSTLEIVVEHTYKADSTPHLIKCTANDAFYQPRHFILNAAKAVREQIGTSRKSGGGRKKELREPQCATDEGLQDFIEAFESNLPYLVRHEEFMERLIRLVTLYQDR